MAEQAVHLLDAHLSPAVTVTYRIGYDVGSPAGNSTPAITTNTEYGCQIAINKEAFTHDAAGNANWELEILAHEMFHCYEVQIEKTENYAHVTNTEAWVQEGLARWVDMTLFSSDPIAESRESLKTYFATSTVSLFARRYDAVGFWGHLQDVSGDLWVRIPRILEAAVEGSKRALTTSLGGLSDDEFFDSWGSSALNDITGGRSWTARSPFPSSGFSAPPHQVSPAGPDSPWSTKLEADSTDQLHINMPKAPPGDIETVRIKLGGGYGRFGLRSNYTGSELESLSFCGGPSGCKPAQAPPSGGCGAGEVRVPTSPLTPLPTDALLGVAAADSPATVTIEYHAVTAAEATGGTCEPGPSPGQPGSTTGTGGSGGDPHIVDFDGALFNFQAAGEFTLLKSTRDNLEVQAREQPFGSSQTVAVNTAFAMQVGAAVVEVDPTAGGLAVLVDHHPLHGGHAKLSGGGSVSFAQASLPTPPGVNPATACNKLSGQERERCQQNVATLRKPMTVVDIVWKDGTKASVWNGLPLLTALDHALHGVAGVLSITVKVARSRLAHLTGVLGNADVPAKDEFRGRNGTHYDAVDILNGDSGTPAQAKILYDEFGASWRVSQHQSLFTYAHGKSTRSYTIANFPDHAFNPVSQPAAKRTQAAAACQATGVSDAAVLHDCEYDVLATGNVGFAGAARQLQPVATSYPTTTPPAKKPPPTLQAVDLGAGSAKPGVAYDATSGDTYVAWIDDSQTSIDLCTVTGSAASCNGGAGPDHLTDPLAGDGRFFQVGVVVQPGGEVVVVAEIDGAAASAGFDGQGVVAWSSPAGGSAFAAASQGSVDGGRLLAATRNAGEAPSGGVVALGGDVGVYGDSAPFGNGFTDFGLTTPAPAPMPVVDASGAYGDQEGTASSQVAVIPDAAVAGGYVVVVVGGDQSAPAGCPTDSPSTGFAVAAGTPATLQTQAAWSSRYFQLIACPAESPVVAAGGPNGGSIGLLESEGPGLAASGSNGVYYRPFDVASGTFGAPVLVSDETARTTNGATGLALARDPSGGADATWLDHRGYVLAYSADGGASWSPPAAIGLRSDVSDLTLAATAHGEAEIAYSRNPGSGSREYLAPLSYARLAGG